MIRLSMTVIDTSTYAPATKRDKKTGVISVVSPQTEVTRHRVIKTDTIRRKLPSDLFASTTARVVDTIEMSCTLGIWQDSNYVYYHPGLYGYSFVGEGTYALSTPGSGSFGDLDQRIRGKIKNQNINVLQATAEGPKTVDMFLGAARDLVKVFRSVRSGRAIGDVSRILTQPRKRSEKALANRWLEYQYGIKPLMQDIYGGCEQIAKQYQAGIYRFASVKDTQKASRVVTIGTGSGSTNFIEETLVRNVRCRYRIGDSKLKTLSEIGITNPVALAWELVPFSFVFDWFINVGDFLSGMDALIGVTDLRVNRSYLQLREHHASWIVNDATIQRPWATKKLKRSERFATTSGLAVSLPKWSPSPTWRKIVSAGALIRQQKR